MVSKPWLDHYDEGVPATLQPYPRQTLVDVVDETTRMRPGHTALIFKGERISYGELTWRSDALAAALVEQGVKKGDRVAILMPKPVPDVEVCIMDGDTGQTEMPLGEIGEIALRAPQLMLGYWGRPETTSEILRDGWLYTGDLGYLDEDGYLTIVDRKKDLIKPSGFQVWPREVEEVIAKHPAVAEVGVIGVPDPRTGEAVKAFVVLREGRTATGEEIREFCKASLTGYKVPRQVEFRTSLPKSAVGKVLRRELSE